MRPKTGQSVETDASWLYGRRSTAGFAYRMTENARPDSPSPGGVARSRFGVAGTRPKRGRNAPRVRNPPARNARGGRDCLSASRRRRSSMLGLYERRTRIFDPRGPRRQDATELLPTPRHDGHPADCDFTAACRKRYPRTSATPSGAVSSKLRRRASGCARRAALRASWSIIRATFSPLAQRALRGSVS